MNMNNSQTTKLKTPQQLERVNQIIGSFREKLREANVKAAQAKVDRKPFVSLAMAEKHLAVFGNNELEQSKNIELAAQVRNGEVVCHA